MTKTYFAHPIRTYDTRREAEVTKSLEAKGWKVVNPKDYSKQAAKLVDQAGGGWLPCSVCREKVMEPLFYKLLSKCEVFAYWNPLGTCGVECEMVVAKRLNKIIHRVKIKL